MELFITRRKSSNSINQLGSPVIYGGCPAPLWWLLPFPGAGCGRLTERKKLPVPFSPHSLPLSHTMPLCPCGPSSLRAWPELRRGHCQGASSSCGERTSWASLESHPELPGSGVASGLLRLHLGGAAGACLPATPAQWLGPGHKRRAYGFS